MWGMDTCIEVGELGTKFIYHMGSVSFVLTGDQI